MIKLSAAPSSLKHQALRLDHVELSGYRAHSSGSNTHDYAVISWLTQGSGQLWVNAHYTAQRGDLLLIPAGMPHYLVQVSEDARSVALSVCPSCIGQAWGAPLKRCLEQIWSGASAVRRIEPIHHDEVRYCLERLERALKAGAHHQDLIVTGLMSVLVATLLEATPTLGQDHVERPVVARALEYISAHACAGISLQDVARAVGRSPAHLTTCVREQTGQPVGAWITNVHMAAARELLLVSESSVEHIASAVGFKSASHFHRTFSREHQRSPDQWRRLHQDKPHQP